MKFSTLGFLLLVAMLANGCALFHHRKQPPPPAPASAYLAPATPSTTLNPIVTPDNSLTARVASYNAAGRFVVLSFPDWPDAEYGSNPVSVPQWFEGG